MSKTKDKPRHRMTQIKLKILATILRHRLLTADQIQKRCLPCQEGQSLRGRQVYTRKLLRELYIDKLVQRRTLVQPDLGKNPYVFASTYAAAKTVADARDTDLASAGWDAQDKVITWSNENLFHLLRENDVQFMFEMAAKQAEVELREWQSDRMLAKEKSSRRVKYMGPHGGTYEKTLIPDGMYVFAHKIRQDGRTGTVLERVFLEVDMGSQTISQRSKTLKHPQRTWQHKVRSYITYMRSGGLCERQYGSTNARVVVLTTSNLRLGRMKEATESVGGTDRFWFATFDEFTEKTALDEPIYLVAGQGDARFSLLNISTGGET